MHGQFVWYELTTPDVEAAKKFYPQLTGWGTQQFDEDYTMWTADGVPYAGIFRLTTEMRAKGIPPNWMPYIEAGNVDATAKQVVALGGRVVVEPQDVPGTGRFAVVSDPQGATFGIYKSTGKSQGWDGTQTMGRFSWHELMTTDYKKAFDFYRKLFNWEPMGEMDMGGGMMYFMFGSKGKMFGGMFNRMADMANMPPFWLDYIFVKDVPKAVEIATKAGGRLHRGPIDIPGGQIAILGDPQGAGFAVHHASATAESPKPSTRKTGSTSRRAPAKAAKKAAPKRTAPKKAAPKKAAPKKAAPKKATRKAVKKAPAKKRAVKKSAAKKKSATRGKARRR